MAKKPKFNVTEDQKKRYMELLDEQRPVSAVKAFREDHNCGIAEAWDAIKELRGGSFK